MFKYALYILGILFLLWSPSVSFAQKDAGNPIEKRGFYRTMNMYGGYIHTRGYGGYYRRGWRQTGFSNKIYNVEFLNVNHPKQFKIDNGTQSSYEGKINTVFFLRNSFGWQKTLYDKEVKRGVRVSYFFLFGPTLAFAKPIYINVVYNDPSGTQATERYDYDKHSTQAFIYGRASFLLGLNETRIYPGIHTKFALNFEYSGNDEDIKSLEIGSTFDAFGKEIPILAKTYNDQFFVTLYLSFHFGRRFL